MKRLEDLGQITSVTHHPALLVDEWFGVHSLTLSNQFLETAVVPAVPMPTSHSTIWADTDRLCSSGNNPVFFILKSDTQSLTPRPGDQFTWACIPADNGRAAKTLLTKEIEEEPG